MRHRVKIWDLKQTWQVRCGSGVDLQMPSWICCTLVWTTHEEYLMDFVTVPNLV